MRNQPYSHELLQALLDYTPDGLVLTDQGGRVVLCNKAGQALLDDAAQGKRQGAHIQDILPDYQKIIRHDAPEYLTQISKASGEAREVSVRTFPVPLQPELTGLSYIIRDVTHRKHAQERLVQAQKMEAIGAMTSTIAHNFNNMLTVITGSVRELKCDMDSGDCDLAQLHADTIEAAAHKGASQILRLMMFARAPTAGDKFPCKPLDLNAFIMQIKALITLSLSSGIELSFDLEDGLPLVCLDDDQFESALFNMVVNASDAMPGGGRFRIATQAVTLDEGYTMLSPDVKPGAYVCLSLSDTGTGMPATVKERLFEPFYTTKPPGKGTGLGLSVVYGFVQKSGGYIHVYSEEGHGTTFKIYLPALASNQNSEAPLLEPAQKAPPAQKTVFIVEDHPLMLDMAQRAFKRLGFEAITASSAAEARQKIGQINAQIDLMFIDMFLEEGEDSLDLAQELQAQCANPCPVVYSSGYDQKDLAQSYDMSGKYFIAKPFGVAKLAEILKDFDLI